MRSLGEVGSARLASTARSTIVKPLQAAPRRSQAPDMDSDEHTINGPTGKPSQAEGEDPDRPEQHHPEPADGHPSQAEGEDADA
jgi:hypothetical protein